VAALIVGLLVALPSEAQQPLTGSWQFTWDGNAKNTNVVDLKHEAGTITGIYVNDSKDKCPVAGRMSGADSVTLFIVCPKWDIRAEGAMKDQALVGKYVAYGNSKGEFRMSKR
jgi:hypothetical protein